MEPATTRPDAAPSRLIAVTIVGVGLISHGVLLGWAIFLRGDEPFAVDVWWNDLLLEWWVPAIGGFSRVMNWLGGGWFGVLAVPIIGAGALVLLRRPWSAAYFLAAEIVSVAIVQVLKHVFGRVRPEEILVLSDVGSYPSGHVANAATIATVAVVLFPRLWVVVVGSAWVVLMAFSRTYLHAHWLSDTVGGALVGTGAALVVAAVFWSQISRERADAAQRRIAVE